MPPCDGWRHAGLTDEQRYRAASSKDARFDGVFVVAVTSTGIYCRPSCPAITPKRSNVRFYRTAAAAQDAGFRACKRCRPDAAPGSPEWNARADLAGRAMRLIGDGVVDREQVAGLARRLGYSARQVHRTMVVEVGAGPLALARAQRAQTARVLIETTALPLAEVAFAAGFASVRQFNATIRDVFAGTPTELRARARPGPTVDQGPGTVRLRLPYRPPIDLTRMFRFLGARAVPGVEAVHDGALWRTLDLPNGVGVAALRRPAVRRTTPRRAADTAAGGTATAGTATTATRHLDCELTLTDVRDLITAVHRCRRWLDLDADPDAVAAQLAGTAVVGPLAAACAGRRSPGHVDAAELAVRAVLGQQVSVAAARRLAGRLTARYGRPLPHPVGPLTHCFPTAETLAETDPTDLPMPRSRCRTLVALAAALAAGELHLDPGARREAATEQLLAVDGIGHWTAGYIRMRALSDPDVFLAGDAGVRRALDRLGVDSRPDAATRLAEAWRPWRSYAVHHLWASSEGDLP